MIPTSALKSLHLANDGKLILLVQDGLGGLPHPDTGLTELELATAPLGAAAVVQVTVGGTPGAGAATVVVEFTEAAS